MRDGSDVGIAVVERAALSDVDRAAVTQLHADVYAAETGWDHRFVDYVAHTLMAAAARWDAARDRLWLVQQDGAVVGSIAIVHADDGLAQLRWLVVHPSARGHGIGRRLVDNALRFSRDAGYRSIFLLTTGNLEAASRLYVDAGFTLVEERLIEAWGAHVSDQRYEIAL